VAGHGLISNRSTSEGGDGGIAFVAPCLLFLACCFLFDRDARSRLCVAGSALLPGCIILLLSCVCVFVRNAHVC
jgi:hypothetical protein